MSDAHPHLYERETAAGTRDWRSHLPDGVRPYIEAAPLAALFLGISSGSTFAMIGATLTPTTYLPFGGGNRRCIGATFSTVEMRVVLREILRRVELCTTTEPEEKQKSKHVTFVPHRGARIRVRAVRDVASTSAVNPPTCPANHGSTPSSDSPVE